ncbi:MAG TPA: Glu/Leu/Phe/Val dehydrogenase dimerization domain-containing protein [Acidimicrobiales bacterium]|nr:Glu/Leu/Phe/Val dehydrogenase dimerization domain-containing protein [Acidimicrobiales bacterium]
MAGTLFDRLERDGHEQVAWYTHRPSGLRAMIAIHSTALGPALGGTRFLPYASEDHALTDVLRLSRGMTYKAALAGLDLGGGKAVIVGDPRALRSEALLRAYGRFVDSFGGRYITAEDVGTDQADMDLLREETVHVTGTSESVGGSGDPSPATALGLVHALHAVVDHRFGSPSLEGCSVAVVGVGKVGAALVRHLRAAGAEVAVADIDPVRVQAMVATHGARALEADDALSADVDVLAPCALGAVLDATTIPRLRCAVVCGSANNQLAEPEGARRLADRGILYAPDYVVSAGGIINIAEELVGYDRARATAKLAAIGATTARVLTDADRLGITTIDAADRLAESRLNAAATAGARFVGSSGR